MTADVGTTHEGKVGTFHRGDRLRKARIEAGISVARMAATLDVSTDSIARWERDRGVRKMVVDAYARATGYSSEWLMYGDTVPRYGDTSPVTLDNPDARLPLAA